VIRSVAINQRRNGTFTVVVNQWDKESQAWRRKSVGTFPTRGEAKAKAAEMRSGGSVDDATRRTVNLAHLVAWWTDRLREELEAGRIARLTFEHYTGDARRYIVPGLGHRQAGQLTQADVRAWVIGLQAGNWSKGRQLSPRTTNKALMALRRLLADAGIEPNPAILTKKRDRPKARRVRPIVRPTAGEGRAFLAHVKDCDPGRGFEALWRLAVEHGLRRAELCGLSWGDIDIDDGRLTVARSLQHVRRELFVKTPKSEKGSRTHLMSAATIEALGGHRTRQLEDRLAMGAAWEASPLGLDFVFRDDRRKDQPLYPSRLSRIFREEAKCAGLREGVTLHSWRHSNGSVLVAAGMPLTDVAAHLGIDLATAVMTYLRELDPEERQKNVAGIVAQQWG
jgi:integrase